VIKEVMSGFEKQEKRKGKSAKRNSKGLIAQGSETERNLGIHKKRGREAKVN